MVVELCQRILSQFGMPAEWATYIRLVTKFLPPQELSYQSNIGDGCEAVVIVRIRWLGLF